MGGGFSSALGSLANALFLIASIYIYIGLLRQIARRSPGEILETERRFGLPEAALAIAIGTFFLLTSLGSTPTRMMNLRTRDLVLTALIELSLVVFITVFLFLRRFHISQLTGLGRLSFGRVLATGFILLIVAYPLIVVADALTSRLLGSGSSHQAIIEMFNSSQSLKQRILIIVLAVAIAPIAEEFIFRFFLYGVLRRYAGRAIGLVLSALLFAMVHAHLPSLAPLFVLGCCFTLAYEWSGSLLVNMTMHAMFNAITLLTLAFPSLLQE